MKRIGITFLLIIVMVSFASMPVLARGYASGLKCIREDCDATSAPGSKFCADHTCQRAKTWCSNEVEGDGVKCFSCSHKNASINKSAKNGNKSKTTRKIRNNNECASECCYSKVILKLFDCIINDELVIDHVLFY